LSRTTRLSRWILDADYENLTFIVLTGLVGYRRRYLDDLLGVLARQTRDTVVEIAYEEAQKVAAAVGDVPPSDPAWDIVGCASIACRSQVAVEHTLNVAGSSPAPRTRRHQDAEGGSE
jgi:hypothetical protein